MFLSLRPRLCSLPFPGGLSPCTGLRNCQAKVTWLDRSWRPAQTHLHKVTPLRGAVLRGWWLLQASVPDEGGKARGWGECVGWPWRLPGPYQLGYHVGWEGGALSPREQAGFGGSRLCLHLPHTPSPRSLLFPGALPPLGSLHALHICSSSPAAGSAHPQPSAPLEKAAGAGAGALLPQPLAPFVGGAPNVAKRLHPSPHPTSLERAAAWEWEQESPGAWQTDHNRRKGIKGNQRDSRETESWCIPSLGGAGSQEI